jgi:hypothetical protein
VTDFIFQSNEWLLAIAMLIVLGLAIELPYRFAGLLPPDIPKPDSFNAVQAGILTLSAFVLSLSFAQASARFDSRRVLVVTEANAIGSTWLLASQLEPAQSKHFRQLLIDDTAARLKVYQTHNDPELDRLTVKRTNYDQDQLSGIASAALSEHPTNLGLQLLMRRLNNEIDVSAEARQAATSHVPTAIIVLTLALVTLAALSLGFRFALEKSRPVLLSAVYVVAYVVVIIMAVDYDRPNTGFIKVNLTPLTLQLQSMQQTP